MKGLIIKSYWANKILSGEKTIEVRGSNTKIRGRIGIIISGTSKVWGTVDLVDSFLIENTRFSSLKDKHLIDCNREEIPYKKLYGWKLENPIRFKNPVEYNHKKGCVIWVNLEDLESGVVK